MTFDWKTTERGIDYYLDERVIDVRAEGMLIVGIVAGSRPQPYTAVIDVSNTNSSRCSCPVGSACKHLVAVVTAVLDGALPDSPAAARLEGLVDADEILAAVDEAVYADQAGPRERWRGEPRESEAPQAPDRPAVERTIDLADALRRVDGEQAERRFFTASAPRFTDDPERAGWRVALIVAGGHDEPLLGLARQYRRKDGSWGRLEALRDGETLLFAALSDRELAERIRVLGGIVPLSAFAREIERTGLPLFAGDARYPSGAHATPVRVVCVDRIELELVPCLAWWQLERGEEPLLLSLRLHVDSRGERITVADDAFGQVGDGLGRAVASFADAGLVLVAEETVPLAALRPWIVGYGGASIDSLAALERLARRFPRTFTLRRPDRIRIVPASPPPCFVIGVADGYFALRLEHDAIDATVGYDGDEFVIHDVRAELPVEAIEAGTRLMRTRPYRRTDEESGIWRWDRPLESEPDPIATARALSAEGYTVYVEDAHGRRRVEDGGRLAVHVSSGTDWFGPTISAGGGASLDPGQLDELVRRGALEGRGTLLVFDEAEIDRIRRVLEVAGQGPGGRLSRADLASLADLSELADTVAPDLGPVRELAEELLRGGSRDRVPLPGALAATLRPYQHDGLSWLASLARHGLSGCLADDMGLGKTVQALAFMLHLAHADGAAADDELLPGGFLVVAPLSTLGNWFREAGRFAPGLSVLVHHGAERDDEPGRLVAHDLVVTNYATAGRDLDLLRAIEWRLVVLDEAQAIKNPHARTTHRLKRLTARLRLCLTGTPVENVSTDLWSIMDFLVPGLLGTLSSFSHRFPGRNVSGSSQAAGRLDRLRRIVEPFLLRRTKEAVAPELPPRTEVVLTCEMSRKQARFYETLRTWHEAQVRAAIESRDMARIGAAVFTGLLRLRQAALYPEDADPTGEGIPSVKETELLEQLDEIVAEGNRSLVFSQFTTALSRLRDRAAERGITTLYLDGKTRGRERLIDRFQSSSEPVVFFISLKAGGTGINLTAADYVYICDPWWNPQVERQAVDRAHRIGRDRPVVVTRLVTAGTVEEKVLELQEQKRALAADLISENTAAVDLGSVGELLSLFGK